MHPHSKSHRLKQWWWNVCSSANIFREKQKLPIVIYFFAIANMLQKIVQLLKTASAAMMQKNAKFLLAISIQKFVKNFCYFFRKSWLVFRRLIFNCWSKIFYNPLQVDSFQKSKRFTHGLRKLSITIEWYVDPYYFS